MIITTMLVMEMCDAVLVLSNRSAGNSPLHRSSHANAD
tara:strand:+ start:30314 stop:30427 length:114 start_codon:yes stop_codon:yes gene_type:complete